MVEVLIVVGIVGLLAEFVVSNLMKKRDEGEKEIARQIINTENTENII